MKATVKWPLFKGGKNISSVKKAEFRVEEKKLLFEDISDQVSIDTANAYTKIIVTTLDHKAIKSIGKHTKPIKPS